MIHLVEIKLLLKALQWNVSGDVDLGVQRIYLCPEMRSVCQSVLAYHALSALKFQTGL
jgi:hypothetical protein